MTDTPKLQLPELSVDQSQKEPTHNEALRRLDVLVQPVAISRLVNDPPLSPDEGDTYLVGAAPTGMWSSHATEVAFFMGSAWMFVTPSQGWRYQVADEDIPVQYAGGVWINSTEGETNTMSNVGSGAEIYKEKIGVDFRIRTLRSLSPRLTITQEDDEVQFEMAEESEASDSDSGGSSGGGDSGLMAFFLAGVST